MDIKLKKINFKRIIAVALSKRNLFLIIFFGGLLIFNFNVIYQDIYIKLSYLDASGAMNFFDGKRESIVIKKITDNLKLREDRIRNELKKDHKNIFIYELPPELINGNEELAVPEETGNIISDMSADISVESKDVPESMGNENYPELSN